MEKQIVLTEKNYDEFMALLDVEFVKKYPEQLSEDYKHSETMDKEYWLENNLGYTIQEIIDDDVSHWEE